MFEAEMPGQALDVLRQQIEVGRGAGAARFAVAAKIDPDDPEGIGESALLLEEAAMGHQAVEEHERPPFAFVLEGDLGPVSCRVTPQNNLPLRPVARDLERRISARV